MVPCLVNLFPYIGPSFSHVADILNQLENNLMVRHGEVDLLVSQLLAFADLNGGPDAYCRQKN